MATTYELIVKAVDKSSGPLAKIESNLKKTERASSRLSGNLKTAGAALAAFATGGVVRKIISTTASFEDLQDTLNTVTGSAKEGAIAFKGIQDFATRTQFGIEDLTTTYIKLAGAGIRPTEKLLTVFTDTAAVTTDQIGTLNAMADLFSRTTAGGLGLEELNRLADRGVPVFAILERQLGLTRLEISEFGKTAEGAAQIRDALERGLTKSFGGATKKKLDNLSTAMSNFGINITLAAARLGKHLRPQLTAAINDANKFLETNGKLIDSLGSGLGDALLTSSKAIQVVAQNIELVKNAALAFIGVRLLGNLQGTAAAAAQLSGGSKNLSTRLQKVGEALSKSTLGKSVLIFGNLFTLFTNLGRKVLGLVPMIGRVGLAIIKHAVNPVNLLRLRFLASMTPVGRLATVIMTVLGGAISFVKGAVERTLGSVVSFGEFGSAVMSVLGKAIQNAGTYLKQTFLDATESVKGWFNGVKAAVGRVMQGVADFAKGTANFIANAFVVSIEFIKGLFTNLPGFFKGAMRAVMELGKEAVNSLVNGFAALGPALKMAVQGDFQGALDKVASGFAADFSAAIAKGMADAPSLIPDIDAAEIMGVDRVAQGAKIFQEVIEPLRISINKTGVAAFEAAEDGIKPLTDAIADQIAANREAEKAAQLKTFKDIEAAHGANQLKQSIDDVNLGLGDTGDVLEPLPALTDDFTAAVTRNTNAAAELIANMQSENLELQQLEAALANVGEIARMTGVSQSELTKQLQEKIRMIRGETEATKENNSVTNTRISAGAQIINTMKEENTKLRELKLTLDNVGEIARMTGVNESELTRILKEQIAVLEGNTTAVNNNAAAKGSTNAGASVIAGIQSDNKRLQELKATLANVGEIARMTGVSENTLTKELTDQIDILEGNTAAGNNKTSSGLKNLTASERIIESMKNENKELKNLKAAREDVANIARKQGIAEAELTKRLDERIASLENQGEKVKTLSETITEGIERQFNTLSGNLARSIVKGKGLLQSFKSFFDGILEQMLQAVIQKKIMEPLMNSIMGGGGLGGLGGLFGGGGGFGGLGGMLGGLFGGGGGGIFSMIGGLFGFANGGVPPRDRPSIVGEKGPELFMPGTTGRVIPNDDLGDRGAGPNIQFNIQAIDSRSGTEFILENKTKIINMINSAQRQRGKLGIID